MVLESNLKTLSIMPGENNGSSFDTVPWLGLEANVLSSN